MLDEGRLTDNKGRLANFKNSLIIMTSNLGSDEIQKAFEENTAFETAQSVAQNKVMNLLRQSIRPEFLNRIDDIVMFSPLTKIEIKQIVKLQFSTIQKSLEKQNITLELTDEALNGLTEMAFDPQYGGRPVRRVLQQKILNSLSKMLLGESSEKQKKLVVDFFEGAIVFRKASSRV